MIDRSSTTPATPRGGSVRVEPGRRAHKRGDGEGSITQRRDGLWMARLAVGRLPDGRLDRRTVYSKTRAEVQRKLATLRASAQAGTLADPGADRITLAAFLERWL